MSYAELNSKYNNLVKNKDILNADVSKTYESSLICSNDRQSFMNLQNLIKRFETLETYVKEAKTNSASLDYTVATGKLITLISFINSDISQLNTFQSNLQASSREAFEELQIYYNVWSNKFEEYRRSYLSYKRSYFSARDVLEKTDLTDLARTQYERQVTENLTSMSKCITDMQDALNKMQKLSDAGVKSERVVSNSGIATTYTGGKFQTTYFDQPY